jgi:hypothetical protein
MEWFKNLGRYDNVEHVAALHVDAQNALDRESRKVASKAERKLAQHKHDGHAAIEIDEGDVDRHVVLSDERGQKAALSIEFGRSPDDEGKGGMEGLFILHDAAGLKRRQS